MGLQENLNSFEKGKSGNPSGRPKGAKNRATTFKKFLSLKTLVDNPTSIEGTKIKGTIEDQIAMAQIKKALDGDLYAFREIMDAVYGKVPYASEPTAENQQKGIPASTPFTIIDPLTHQIVNLDIGESDE